MENEKNNNNYTKWALMGIATSIPISFLFVNDEKSVLVVKKILYLVIAVLISMLYLMRAIAKKKPSEPLFSGGREKIGRLMLMGFMIYGGATVGILTISLFRHF